MNCSNVRSRRVETGGTCASDGDRSRDGEDRSKDRAVHRKMRTEKKILQLVSFALREGRERQRSARGRQVGGWGAGPGSKQWHRDVQVQQALSRATERVVGRQPSFDEEDEVKLHHDTLAAWSEAAAGSSYC